MMYCTQCGTKNEDGALSCAKCGEVLLLPEDLARAGAAETIHCTQCGAPNRAGASNCTKCGEALLSPEDLAAFAKARSRVSKKATKSFLLGLLGMIPCLFFAGIPAIIYGVLALREIRASHGRVKGRKRAILGIVLGLCGPVYWLFLGLYAWFV